MSFKITVSTILDKVGLLDLFAKMSQSRLIILMYHHVQKDNFEKQLLFLKKYYHIISEDELVNYYYSNKKMPKRSVLITFDDGYLNTYTQAYPILKTYQKKALIFLPTTYIGKEKMAWYDLAELRSKNKEEFETEMSKLVMMKNEQRVNHTQKYKQPTKIPSKYKFMNWSQINEIKSTISLGSHTHTHPICTQTKTVEEELKKSNEIIFKKTNTKVRGFCYPNGIYNEEVAQIVKKHYKIGYSSDFGTNNKNSKINVLRRIGIPENENISVFKLKLGILKGVFGILKPKRFK